ncbi:unnamed protein product [Anisakis simplex]|uniref:Fcf2 domain-containing protein n=1 Tax=Anisakis simplex TaxID=6269 RepID=A0A0M3K931_ANISI|nr:unnamed protein product [Anisakis simplex]
MSDEQSVRRSERLRGRESRSASVEVLVQRDSSVEVISSVESSAVTEDQNAATVTSSSSSQRRKTPTPVSSVTSSRRISSLRRRASNESSGENTKDSDDPTTPQTSKTPSRQRSSARKERGVSVESNSSADGSVKSASSSTTPRRRRRTIGVVSEPLVEVINEEDESAERSQEDADIIAYHTRSHGPSEEVVELDAVIKRRSTHHQSQDGQSSAGGSEQSVEAEDATMGSSVEHGFALTLETLSQEEIAKYIASSSSSLQSDMDTKLASDNAEDSSQNASTKSDAADKDSDAEGSRKQQSDTTVSSAIIISQTESNHSLESLSVPHLESHKPSDVVPTEIDDDSRGKGGKVNVDEANDEQFTKGVENDEQQSELRMQSISAVINELVTVRCEENVIDERIDRHASEESLQMSTEDSSVPIIGEDSGGALKSSAKTDNSADNVDGDARKDTQLSLNEEEHRCEEQKSSLLAEETDRSHADKDVEFVMKEANEASDKMSSSEIVTETVEEQSVLKERTPEHDQMNDSGQQMELAGEEKKREIESEKSKNECESKNVSENASGNVDEEVESDATDKESECWPSISDASSIWHK